VDAPPTAERSQGLTLLDAFRDLLALDRLSDYLREFGAGAGVDASLSRLREKTGDEIDLLSDSAREALLEWLRSWGCRHLRRTDTPRTSEALLSWWTDWGSRLPAVDADLTELSGSEIGALAAAYEALARRPAAGRSSSRGEVEVTFGDTAAAKALFAIRRNAVPPWDAPIRRSFGWTRVDADRFGQFLVATSDALRGLAARLGVDARDLPTLLGHPQVTPVKLVDEYLWIRVTRGR